VIGRARERETSVVAQSNLNREPTSGAADLRLLGYHLRTRVVNDRGLPASKFTLGWDHEVVEWLTTGEVRNVHTEGTACSGRS
jgi:hypothetical protein